MTSATPSGAAPQSRYNTTSSKRASIREDKPVSVLDKLATSLNRRDEVPNQELARRIVSDGDAAAVKELIENLHHKDKAIQSDCIKVLYEIGAANPDLIAKYYREFAKMLESKHPRLVWGAMTALDTIAAKEPKAIYSMLSKILEVADTSGSVIARDHGVGILVKLGSFKRYKRTCLPLLIEQLNSCPNNQFPMYVEMAAPVIDADNRKRFRQVIERRVSKLDKESQEKRVAKVLRKLMQE
jgi:hypothetical protein